LDGKDLLNQRLELLRAFLVALSFDFLRELVSGDEVFLVQLN